MPPRLDRDPSLPPGPWNTWQEYFSAQYGGGAGATPQQRAQTAAAATAGTARAQTPAAEPKPVAPLTPSSLDLSKLDVTNPADYMTLLEQTMLATAPPQLSGTYDPLAAGRAAARAAGGGGGAAGGGGYTRSNYTPPPPRAAYGPYLAGDLAMRTIGLDEKTRVDPYTGTRYTMGNDGTWRESGSLSRQDLGDLRAAGAMPPVAQELRDQTINGLQMSANPMLRGGAGTAGLGGTLQPGEVPQFSSLANFVVPGLGFNAADYRPGSDFNLNSVRLPTPVANRPYGYDFGPGAIAGGGARTSGPAAVSVDMPRYMVPNNYLGGASGFSAGPGGKAFFQPFALPFNVSRPTFGPLAQSAPATVEAPSRLNDYQPAALGPGTLQPGGMLTPGGAGALYINGPQTADIRNGGVGMGFNMDMITRDFGRGSPSDPAGKAMAALSLMNAQQAIMNNPEARVSTPLDAFLMLQQPSMSNYGAPGDSTPGQKAAAEAAAQQAAADDQRRELEAMYGGGGGRFAQGGTVEMLPPPHMLHPFAQGGVVETDRGQPRLGLGHAPVVAPMKTTDEMGINAPMLQQPQQQTVMNLQQVPQTPTDPLQSVRPFARGGTVMNGNVMNVQDVPDLTQDPFRKYAKGGSVVAPIRTTEEQGGIVPGGQQQQPLRQPLALPTAGQASASNTEANLSPIQTGETTSQVQPQYGVSSSPASDQTVASPGYGTNTGIAPISGQGGLGTAVSPDQQAPPGANPDLYKPFNDALAYLAALNRQRENQSVWRLGKLAAPVGVGTLQEGQTPQNLPPGVFYDPTQLINTRVADIKSLQDKLAAYGNPGTMADIINEMQPWNQAQGMWDTINSLDKQIAGYGPLDPSSEYEKRLAALGLDINKYQGVEDVRGNLQALGDVPPFAQVQQSVYDTTNGINYIQDVINLINSGQPPPPDLIDPQTGAFLDPRTRQPVGSDTGSYQALLGGILRDFNTTLAQQKLGLEPAAHAQSLRDELARMDPQGQNMALLADALSRQGSLREQRTNAYNLEAARTGEANLRNALGGNNEALVKTMLNLLTQRQNARSGIDTASTQLGNLLALGVPGAGKLPGFSTGGTIHSGIRGEERSGIRGEMHQGIRAEERQGIRGEMRQGIRGYAKGGNFIADATKNAHGQFRAKAQAAGMSTRAYANKMSDAPGRTGKQARLAKTLMSFHADGGTMVTPEPIVGVGMVTGRPRFMVGEPQRPGGPPMKERLTITPMNQPNRLPGLSRAS